MKDVNVSWTADGSIKPGDKLRPGWRNGKRRQWLDAFAVAIGKALAKGKQLPPALVNVIQITKGEGFHESV